MSDVIYVLYRDWSTNRMRVATVPVIKRCRGYVAVDRSPETGHAARLFAGYYDSRSDAVAAFEKQVLALEEQLRLARENLAMMRAADEPSGLAVAPRELSDDYCPVCDHDFCQCSQRHLERGL